MDHRRVRLGDIVDDYCPRERRLTNHAVVAMIEGAVKQTRCLTCDTEHPYKQAKVPSGRKRKESPAALCAQVLADRRDGANGGGEGESPQHSPRALEAQPADFPRGPDEAPAAESVPDIAEGPPGEGPVHRPLIRATLPRPEGQVATRQPPSFTIRQVPARSQGPSRNGGSADPQRWKGGPGHRPQGAQRGGGPSGGPGAGRTGGPSGGGAGRFRGAGRQERQADRSRPGAARPMRSGKKSRSR
jgi:hypothetical protein